LHGAELGEHRLDLLFVVRRLRHVHRHDQIAAHRDRRLGIVTLLEAAARCRHDARLLVGQI